MPDMFDKGSCFNFYGEPIVRHSNQLLIEPGAPVMFARNFPINFFKHPGYFISYKTHKRCLVEVPARYLVLLDKESLAVLLIFIPSHQFKNSTMQQGFK